MFLLLVTLISLVLAVIMSAIAWRVSQEERRRSEARVAALAADIRAAAPALAEDDLHLRPTHAVHSVPRNDMFTASAPSTTGSRLAAVATIGVVVFVLAAAAAVVFGGSASRSVTASTAHGQAGRNAAQPTTPNPATPVPLELLALAHERDGARLTVRGVIRNPAGGTEVDDVTAVVFLFNADGGFVGSGRATIESAVLVPGSESAFTVNVSGATDVARYRVSFRADNRIVPHVDRRDHIQAKS